MLWISPSSWYRARMIALRFMTYSSICGWAFFLCGEHVWLKHILTGRWLTTLSGTHWGEWLEEQFTQALLWQQGLCGGKTNVCIFAMPPLLTECVSFIIVKSAALIVAIEYLCWNRGCKVGTKDQHTFVGRDSMRVHRANLLSICLVGDISVDQGQCTFE